uniref:Trafficking protein particle complex subunit 5 n=1 Tax=Heterorhabditis bacteriophora TaxID=37862 RepID=A0A1I7XBR4_HETBA
MVKPTGILDKSLSRGKNEVNLSTFAVLFSEMVRYAQNRAETVSDLHDKLAAYGESVGVRMLDVITLRERGYKRETKLLGMLMFIKSTVWKNLFGKEADKLERSNDDQCTC